ncbi:MAG: hypothetical protein Q7U02_02970 [Desulfosalsimonadaceae bacterium]|nr:hypothetical protein [Desulfosalsimonadaceae bacterium]
MDFGDIFFIAVFIIIIVSNVYKQMKKARLNTSGGEAPVKKPGWKTALELVLEEARKQMENQAKQEPAEAMAGRPTGWEGILQSAPDVNPSEESAQPEKIQMVHGDMKLSRAGVSGKPPLRLRERQVPATERIADTLKERMVKPGPAAVEKKDYYAVAADKKTPQILSQEALRNAVVWAEILAPPVGLRDM